MESTDDRASLQRLLGSLALSERFALFVLRCPAPLELAAARRRIDEGLSALRQRPVALRILDPYDRDDSATAMLTREQLAERVLVPLAAAPGYAGAPVIFDATCAHPRDDGAFRWLFQRMNELRNTIAGGLEGELIVAVPPWMELMLTEEAPDFWSIRSGEAEVPAFARPVPPLLSPAGLIAELTALFPDVRSEASLEEMLQRARTAVSTGDWDAAEAAFSALGRSAAEKGRWLAHDVAPMCEFALLLLAFRRHGWASIAVEATHRVEALPHGGTGGYLLPEVAREIAHIFGLVALSQGAIRTAERWLVTAYESTWSYWAGGVLRRGIPQLVRIAHATADAFLADAKPTEALTWVWRAESFWPRNPWVEWHVPADPFARGDASGAHIETPWVDWYDGTPLGPTPEDYVGLAELYSALGDERRARQFRTAAESAVAPALASSIHQVEPRR